MWPLTQNMPLSGLVAEMIFEVVFGVLLWVDSSPQEANAMRFVSHFLAFAAGAFTVLALMSPRSPLSMGPADVHRLYYADGSVETECPLDSQGRLHGEMKRFWPSGRLRSIVDMCHGAKGRGILYEDSEPDAAETE